MVLLAFRVPAAGFMRGHEARPYGEEGNGSLLLAPLVANE